MPFSINISPMKYHDGQMSSANVLFKFGCFLKNLKTAFMLNQEQDAAAA